MFDRFALVSLFDMERFEIGNLVSAAAYLNAVAGEFSVHAKLIRQGVAAPARLPDQTRIWTLKSIERIKKYALTSKAGLLERAAVRAFDDLVAVLAAPRAGAADLEQIKRHCTALAQMIVGELSGPRLYTLGDGDARLFEDVAPFLGAVEDAFPSASFDIEEAAKCRALGRWTASVMHLMRVMETGLATLARYKTRRIGPRDFARIRASQRWPCCCSGGIVRWTGRRGH